MSTPTTIAEMIRDTVRTLTAATPAPRALPYLGLDHPSGTALTVLDRLGARGIFRKYELVLDLGTPFGAVSRWLVARLGGDALAALPSADAATAAGLLNRRAPTRAHVQCLAATATTLPLASARFTHVWLVETLPSLGSPAAVLREAYRVVRPGGWLAVQELLPAEAGTGGWEPLARRIRAAGFFAVEAEDVTADAVEQAPQLLAARVQFDRRLRESGVAGTRLANQGTQTRAAITAGTLRVVQVVAKRPG